MFANKTFLAARMSAASAASSNGSLIDPDGLIVSSDSASTSWGSDDSDTTGLKGTAQKFRVLVGSAPTTVQFTARVRVPWTLTSQSAGGATRGTIFASLLVNGVAVATGMGSPRNLNSANGTQFVELIELVMSAPASVSPGSEIAIQVQPEVTIASGTPGTNWEPTLRHDPQAIASQLVVEFQGLTGGL